MNLLRKTKCAILLVFCFANILSAQTKIQGFVIDNNTKSPLELANVALFQADTLIEGTITDKKGYYEINVPQNGNFRLEVFFLGYEKYSKNIDVEIKNKTLKIETINLELINQELDEINVTTEKSQIEHQIDKTVINITKSNRANGGTAVDVLRNAPAISVDINNNILLRGSSDYIVLIDKRQTLTNNNDILNQINVENIEKIEIITNPSSKYMSEGKAGIIHIITKKEGKNGINGNIYSSVSNKNGHKGGINLSSINKTIQFYLGAFYNKKIMPGYRDISSVYSSLQMQEYSDFNKTNNIAGIEGGFDWSLNKKHTLTLFYIFSDYDIHFKSKSDLLSVVNSTNDYTTNKYNTNLKFKEQSYYLKYNFDIDENKHLVLSSSILYNNEDFSDELNEYMSDPYYSVLDPLSQTLITDAVAKNKKHISLDYDHTTEKIGKIELGTAFTNDIYENANRFRFILPVENIVDNNFDYQRDIFSAYLNYSITIKELTTKCGIRSEYTDRNIISKGESLNYNKINWFPYLNVSYSFKNKQSLQYSFSKRISRPSARLLDPVPLYESSNNIFVGSNSLLPENTFTNELNYFIPFKKGSFSWQNYYRKTLDAVTDIMSVNSDGIVTRTLINSESNDVLGSEISIEYKPAKWFRFNTGAAFNYEKIEGEINNQKTVQKFNTYKSWVKASFFIKENTSAHFSYSYQAPKKSLNVSFAQTNWAMVSVNQSLFSNKLNVSLAFQNVFNSKSEYQIKEIDSSIDYLFAMDWPVLSLNINYQFNKYKRKRINFHRESEYESGNIY